MSESIVPVEAEFTLLKRHLAKIRRRATVRYRCDLATIGRLTFPGTGEIQETWVHDLSASGIGLNLNRSLPDGAPVVIRLKGTDGKAILETGASVIHSTQEVDGSWRVGCQFDAPLTAEQLDAFL